MTLICSHRVNDPAGLDEVPLDLGVEMDLRSDGRGLVVVHDAFAAAPRFEDWLDHYHHRFLIANVKEEGLELEVERMLAERGITAWAFLDQSFPFLVRTLRRGESRTMVRISEFESIETPLALEVRPDWVWVDSFTGRWPEEESLQRLSSAGYRLMVVSPELQGRAPEEEIAAVQRLFRNAGVVMDGVCTKHPEAWR